MTDAAIVSRACDKIRANLHLSTVEMAAVTRATLDEVEKMKKVRSALPTKEILDTMFCSIEETLS